MARKWRQPSAVDKVASWAQEFTQGERLLGLFAIADGHDAGIPVPSSRQSKIFVGQERPGSAWRRAVAAPFKLLTGTSQQGWENRRRSTPEEREELLQKSTSTRPGDITATWQFGSWDSMGGQLLVATQPKSKTRFMSFFAVSEKRILVFYVQDASREESFAKVAELGWQQARRNVQWTRDTRRKLNSGGYQVGFTDGSWMTLNGEPALGFPDFQEVFPGTLQATDPIPPF